MRRPVILVPIAFALTACFGGGSAGPGPSGTAPAPSIVRFAVIGDWGAATPAESAVFQQLCAVRQKTPFPVVVTTGDNFYEDGTATAENYARPAACVTGFPGHVWRATWGNHDVQGGDSTEAVLGATRNYRWAFGDVDLWALDSNHPTDDSQRAWLEEGLSTSTKRIKIVYFHHSPFTVGSVHTDDEAVKANWVPLFERHRVALVLTGHSHLYEHHRRSGVEYVVTGGGGAELNACARQAVTLITCAAEHHFLLVEIVSGRIDVRAIRTDGSELDRFSLQP